MTNDNVLIGFVIGHFFIHFPRFALHFSLFILFTLHFSLFILFLFILFLF